MNLLCNGDLRESAKHYIKEGHMVVPGVTKAYGEVNLTKWKDNKNCLSGASQVDTFFDKYKQTNAIAIRCDKITVIEINSEKVYGPKAAIVRLNKLCELIYGNENVDEVLSTCVQYGRGTGFYLIFEYDPEMPNVNLKKLMGLDIEIRTSRDAVIVMAPTVLEGKKFNIPNGEVLPFPYRVKEYILSLDVASKKKKDFKFDNNMNRLTTTPPVKTEKATKISEKGYMRKVYDKFAVISGEGRSDKLFKKCCLWMDHISAENTHKLLTAVNKTFVTPCLTETELKKVFDDALSLGGVK